MEKKQRVPIGEKYWYIDKYGSIQEYIERGSLLNYYHYKSLIYFHTEEEARVMRDKLRAVLNGAEVIEMPSEEEIEAIKNEIAEKLYPTKYASCEPFNLVIRRGFLEGVALINSKIVKKI